MVPGPAVKVSTQQMTYGFDLLLGEAADGADVARRTTELLWKKYGSAAFKDIRPQVLPFEEYGRKYAYINQLKKEAVPVELNGRQCWGINNAFRHGTNFHAWENDVHVGFGIWYYGEKWKRDELRRMAAGMMELSLAALERREPSPAFSTSSARPGKAPCFGRPSRPGRATAMIRRRWGPRPGGSFTGPRISRRSPKPRMPRRARWTWQASWPASSFLPEPSPRISTPNSVRVRS